MPHAGATLPVLTERIDLVGPMLTEAGKPKPPSMRSALRRLHFDLAGARVPEQLAALISVADPDRIHYGSDWPFTPTAVCSALVEQLDGTSLLDDALRERVMLTNAAELFDQPNSP